VKGSLNFWDPPVYVWIQFVIAFTNQNYFFEFFDRRIPTSQLTILQNLNQFKLVNLYLQGFEDWSCGHWRTYLTTLQVFRSNFHKKSYFSPPKMPFSTPDSRTYLPNHLQQQTNFVIWILMSSRLIFWRLAAPLTSLVYEVCMSAWYIIASRDPTTMLTYWVVWCKRPPLLTRTRPCSLWLS